MARIPQFDIRLYQIEDKDQREGLVEAWCELLLIINQQRKNNPQEHELQLTRRAAENIIDVLHSALHPHTGRPVVGMLWDKLEETTKRLIDKTSEDIERDKGRAQAFTECISLMLNSYNPDESKVRKTLMQRIKEKEDGPAKKK